MYNSHYGVDDSSGYRHPAYAAVFSEFGVPRELRNSGGNVLVRATPMFDMQDAMGCYPIFSCINWSGLHEDIRDLASDGVLCLSLVTDPFGKVTQQELSEMFERVIPFKLHFVADLSEPVERIVSGKRLRAAMKSLERLDVRVEKLTEKCVDDWLTLQHELAARHGMKGMKILSRSAVERLFAVPGVTIIQAAVDGETVGMHIELIQGDVVYGHLASYSARGRKIGAAGALHVWEIDHFRGKKAWIDWGGASGTVPSVQDGLTDFKQGFSNATRQTYFCARVLHKQAYSALVKKIASRDTEYFPAYRAGEFS